MPQALRQTEILSPSTYYGAIHLTRLFGKLSFILRKHVAHAKL